MKKLDRKVIIVFLIVIIILSSILLYKINSTPDYDEELYSQVYSEYNEILENIDNNEYTEDVNNIYIEESNNQVEETIKKEEHKEVNKKADKVVALIRISKINILYPIIENTTMENLKVAPTKFAGGKPNEIGNFCVIGHNMKNNEQFSNLKKLEEKDIVEILNTDGTKKQYSVYSKYTVKENDLSCTNQETNGKREVTLITCTNSKKERLVVKCMEV